ncbi:hypothetical protein Gpo141_00015007, partial [Globisporangium polare]
MFSTKNCVLASIAAAALTASSVNAHGNLLLPAPTFSGYGGGFAAVIPSSVLTEPSGMHFNWGPDTNADAFDTAFKAAKEPSLKEFILKNQDRSQASSGATVSAECGYSNPNGTPQPLPASITWAGGNFIHPGPCEAWCDDEIVVPYTANCWKTFSTGVVSYEKAKCEGKKQLTFYWLAVHSPPWQVYIDCVPLSGASASGSSGSTTPTVTAKTPSSTTKAPSSATKAPS